MKYLHTELRRRISTKTKEIGGYKVIFFFYASEQNTRTGQDGRKPWVPSSLFPHNVHEVVSQTVRPPAKRAFEPTRPLLCSWLQEAARQHGGPRSGLDVVDVELLALVVAVVAVIAVLVELETDALVALVAVRIGLVDLCVLGKLAVGL